MRGLLAAGALVLTASAGFAGFTDSYFCTYDKDGETAKADFIYAGLTYYAGIASHSYKVFVDGKVIDTSAGLADEPWESAEKGKPREFYMFEDVEGGVRMAFRATISEGGVLMFSKQIGGYVGRCEGVK